MTQAGAAQPVVSGGAVGAGPALRVAIVSDGRSVLAGPAMRVVEVSDGRITQGNEPLPVVVVTGVQASWVLAGPAVPVVVVSGSLNPTPPWSPTDISGLQWWFKADSLALSDGAAVASWSDSSGNGYTATQGTGANRPIYKTAIVNGLPIVRFDGSNDRLVTASISHGIEAGDMFYAAVVKAPSVLSGYRGICDCGTDSPALLLNATHIDWYLSGDKTFTGNTLTTSTWYTIIVRRFGGTLESSINGTIDTTTFSNSANIANAIITIGDEGGSGGSPWNGDIAEVLMGKTLSNADRDSLTAYVRTKYAHY